jgi:polyferredoxin
MERFNYPKGLISYTSEQQLSGVKSKGLNLKVFAYGAFTVFIFIATSLWIGSRTPLETSILRDRNVLYRTNYLGVVENTYILKVLNKTQRQLNYQISVSGLENSQLTLPKDLRIDAGVMREIPVTLSVDGYQINQRMTNISFTIQAIEKPNIMLNKSSIFYSGNGDKYANR